MKKLMIFVAAVVISLTASAQSNWEKPVDNTPTKERRGLLDRNKTKTIDAKYLEGGVPEVDGKVTWKRTFNVEGRSAEKLYDFLVPYLQGFVKGEEHLPTSQVALINKEEHRIAVRGQEWLVFEDKALSLDRTKFNYLLIVDCHEGKVDVTLTNINYRYEEDRESALIISAEEWITDREAINKKKTGFVKGGVKKFRMKTIDRVEAIFELIEKALN